MPEPQGSWVDGVQKDAEPVLRHPAIDAGRHRDVERVNGIVVQAEFA
ncbi:hypothetical protein [Streptomyces wuyuanensis]